jgi:cytochrome P450
MIRLESVPPAPGELPLIGHTLSILRRPRAFIMSLSALGDVVRVNVGTWPVYFVTHPELIHQILVTQGSSFEKGRIFNRIQPLMGKGLILSGGELHRRQRRLMQPAFHRARIARYVETMERHARALAQSWYAGQTVAIDHAMYNLALTIVTDAMFSTNIQPTVAAEIHHSLPVVVRDAVTRAMLPKMFDAVPFPINRRFDQAAARVRGAIDTIVDDYRTNGTQDDSLLSMLMVARDADTGEPMGEVQLRDEVVTIMMAGTETTGMTLAWLFHELVLHPSIQDRLSVEIADVVGARRVSADDIPKLRYLDLVLRETARLHTPLLFMRRSIAPVQLGGIEISAGAEFAHSPYALHRDKRFYPEPERFQPDRWANDNLAALPKGAYIPFGNGARRCIGDSFAWTEICVIAATILARWRLDSVPGHQVREILAGMPRPHALPLIVRPRNR